MGHLHEQDLNLQRCTTPFTSRPDHVTHVSICDGDRLLLQSRDRAEISTWRLHQQADQLKLERIAPNSRRLEAWLPSILHYLFLDDCRTQRIVIEPRSDNYKMLRNLGKCGYAHLKEFDFPHKRATLGMLLRERFFATRLWVPRDAVATSYSTSLS